MVAPIWILMVTVILTIPNIDGTYDDPIHIWLGENSYAVSSKSYKTRSDCMVDANSINEQQEVDGKIVKIGKIKVFFFCSKKTQS